ncbi:hypothetical protein DFH09DRAFT_1382483 [Mycena vulgaris]|nr:hypothetical protein DFH09DRAFT_1382483 [Mycena vulgaris]
MRLAASIADFVCVILRQSAPVLRRDTAKPTQQFTFDRALVFPPGKALPSPVFYDNTGSCFVYSGNWKVISAPGIPNATVTHPYKQTSTAGYGVSFNFTGAVCVALHGPVNWGDWVYTVTYNASTYWKIPDALRFFQAGLDPTVTHTLTLANLGAQMTLLLSSITLYALAGVANGTVSSTNTEPDASPSSKLELKHYLRHAEMQWREGKALVSGAGGGPTASNPLGSSDAGTDMERAFIDTNAQRNASTFLADRYTHYPNSAAASTDAVPFFILPNTGTSTTPASPQRRASQQAHTHPERAAADETAKWHAQREEAAARDYRYTAPPSISSASYTHSSSPSSSASYAIHRRRLDAHPRLPRLERRASERTATLGAPAHLRAPVVERIDGVPDESRRHRL